MVKALLNAMSVDYPKTHDPAPVFAQAIRARGIDIDASVLDSLNSPLAGACPDQGPGLLPGDRRHRRPGPRLGSPRRGRAPVRGGAARSVAKGTVGGVHGRDDRHRRGQPRRHARLASIPCHNMGSEVSPQIMRAVLRSFEIAAGHARGRRIRRAEVVPFPRRARLCAACLAGSLSSDHVRLYGRDGQKHRPATRGSVSGCSAKPAVEGRSIISCPGLGRRTHSSPRRRSLSSTSRRSAPGRPRNERTNRRLSIAQLWSIMTSHSSRFPAMPRGSGTRKRLSPDSRVVHGKTHVD